MADHINVRTASAGDRQARAASEPESLQHEIAQLRDLDLVDLRLRWRNLFGRAAPTHLPKFLLLRIIAYRMQANAYGDLGKNACRTLDRLASKDAGRAPPKRLGDYARPILPACAQERCSCANGAASCITSR